MYVFLGTLSWLLACVEDRLGGCFGVLQKLAVLDWLRANCRVRVLTLAS